MNYATYYRFDLCTAWRFISRRSGQPAASIPCGYSSSGLPIGLQIAGRRHDDLGVLQVARAYEAMRPALRPWPLQAPTG